MNGPPSERAIQRAILRRMAGLLPTDAFWFHVPNQTAAPADYAKALLGDGMKPGVPDLILLHGGRAFGIEVKRPGERLSPVQCAVHDRMEAAGAPVATVFSADGAESALRGWNLPLVAAWAP